MEHGLEQTNLGYSTKNIPIPSRKEFVKCLINKAEKFIKNIRWRTFFFLNPHTKTEDKETYGFNTTKPPPQVQELREFEDGILDIVQNIQFRNTSNRFQKQLRTDIDNIQRCETPLIPADKTTNFYKLKPDQYNKLIKDNITKDYKKTSPTVERCIITGDKDIATKLKVSDRIDTTAKNQAFITLKDHKPNFNNKPTCRLINPCKSEIGKISKQILERINAKINKATNLNQWKNTDEVISWYNKVSNKQEHSFICFDICEFYPSITEELLNRALVFAGKYDNITEQEKHIIIHTKKAMLYDKNIPWRKCSNSEFDVTMGSYDGAETCELIGLYILSQLQHLEINIGLYRDDGLALCRKTQRQTELIKKEICKIFSNNSLRITIEANKKTVDFLDITLDLRNGTYRPFMKANNTPLYVHKDSNHPPSIIKNIPESVNRRLSKISSSETIFNDTAPPYQEALHKSGYTHQLKYKQQPYNNRKKRNRTRNITWFNPPFSSSVSTNIGRKFFKLLEKCFPVEHKLHKLLNRNTVKLSYSCMPNIKQIISTHNSFVLNKTKGEQPTQNNCNCRRSSTCPLNGNCLTTSVIYQATVTRQDNHTKETYIGLTENTFKTRYNGHTTSFTNEEKRKSTALSEYIWALKDKKINHNINWKIISRARAYNTATKRCNLCLEEKFYIITRPHMASLNKRSELANTCRHRNKHLLSNQ